VDVVSLFMSRYADPERAARKVAKAFHDSGPLLEAPDSPPDAVHMIALPDGPAHETFRDLAQNSLGNTQPFFTQSPDDIIFYREQVTVPLRCLPHLGPSGRAAYVQMLQQQFPPHARVDIRQWYEVL